MTTPIIPNTRAGKRAQRRAGFKPRRVNAMLEQLDADLALMQAATPPTAAQQRNIIERLLKRQRQVIQYLANED